MMAELNDVNVKACIENIDSFLKAVRTKKFLKEKKNAQDALKHLKELLNQQSLFLREISNHYYTMAASRVGKELTNEMKEIYIKARGIIPQCGGKTVSLY